MQTSSSEVELVRTHPRHRTGARRRQSVLLLLAAPAIAALAFASAAAAADLTVGQKAPPFTLAGSDGETYTLESLLASGKQGVVLAWFPKAFTPG
jgi:peroxiredoxin Q/BCP